MALSYKYSKNLVLTTERNANDVKDSIAWISKDSCFSVNVAVASTSHEDPREEVAAKDNDKLVVHLHIGCGTIFQPAAKLNIVILLKDPSEVTGDHKTPLVRLGIGMHNVFEEHSEVTLQVHFKTDHIGDSKHDERQMWNIIGNYNRFSALCKVLCNCQFKSRSSSCGILDYNSFASSCNIQLKTNTSIDTGATTDQEGADEAVLAVSPQRCVFAPLVKFHRTIETQNIDSTTELADVVIYNLDSNDDACSSYFRQPHPNSTPDSHVHHQTRIQNVRVRPLPSPHAHQVEHIKELQFLSNSTRIAWKKHRHEVLTFFPS